MRDPVNICADAKARMTVVIMQHTLTWDTTIWRWRCSDVACTWTFLLSGDDISSTETAGYYTRQVFAEHVAQKQIEALAGITQV